MKNKQTLFIDEVDISNKTVLFRADFDVSLNTDATIANDARIKSNLPSLHLLLEKHNKVICVAKLNRPKGRDPKDSLQVVVDRLQEYLKEYKVILIDDFLTMKERIKKQTQKEILVLENIRFYPEEKLNDKGFAKKLAALADVYVNDAFAMCHRSEASIVGVPSLLPAYGGLLLKKEIKMISLAIQKPKKPVVAIIGGAKISSKIKLFDTLIDIADYILVGGALANVFLLSKGHSIGESFCEIDQVKVAKAILKKADKKGTKIMLPTDVILSDDKNHNSKGENRKVDDMPADGYIIDIGPETQAEYGWIIDKASTVLWNGPMGYVESPYGRQGTHFIYYCMAGLTKAITLVGGGDTISAISKEEYLEKITYISTGGGAMLEFIEKGTLPGIEALKK